MTIDTATTNPGPPDWIDLDRVIRPELRAELAEVTAELRAIEPQLAALGQRAYEVHARADHAEAGAVHALESVVDDPYAISDGTRRLLAMLSGSQQLFDEAIRVGGHLDAWTGCAGVDPEWLTALKKAEAERAGGEGENAR
ncbi:MAG: hypothetical protein ACR2IR_10130 [Acidimicrobiia bacterium]